MILTNETYSKWLVSTIKKVISITNPANDNRTLRYGELTKKCRFFDLNKDVECSIEDAKIFILAYLSHRILMWGYYPPPYYHDYISVLLAKKYRHYIKCVRVLWAHRRSSFVNYTCHEQVRDLFSHTCSCSSISGTKYCLSMYIFTSIIILLFVYCFFSYTPVCPQWLTLQRVYVHKQRMLTHHNFQRNTFKKLSIETSEWINEDIRACQPSKSAACWKLAIFGNSMTVLHSGISVKIYCIHSSKWIAGYPN